MKKLVLVLLVAMLSVPAFAADPAITLKKGTVANTVLVYVDATTSAKIASGIGLTVTATGGNITNVVAAKTGESTAASKGYGIFPGQFTYEGGVPAYGSPVAEGLNTPVVALEFGALYARSVPANAPDPCSLLCTITVGTGVTAIGVTGDATSCGTVGEVPAGIIDEGLNAYAVNASITLAAPCPGDTNGDNKVDFADFLTLKGAYGSTTGSGNYTAAADYDHDGDVDFSDFLVLKGNYGKTCN